MTLTERVQKLARDSIAASRAAATDANSFEPPYRTELPPAAPPEVRDYAPPFHPDRISSATKIMCDSIDKICLNTADEIDARVAEFKAKVSEIEENVVAFKAGMREAADDLISKIKVAMSHYEDLTAKMQESPFNNTIPKILGKIEETRPEPESGEEGERDK